MKISIFGLGYVGTVSLGCLAMNGHTVIGVDLNKTKVDLINQGKSPIVEAEIDRIISEQKRKGSVTATTDPDDAVKNTAVTYICVGTPSSSQGHLNLEAIFRAAKDIAVAISKKQSFHVVAIRSTVLPGTNSKVTEIIENVSRKVSGTDFAVVSNPEFLREGSAVKDFFNPPYTLIGSSDSLAIDMMKDVYQGIKGPFIVDDTQVVELIKYVNNSFHALKISFANEVGNICKKLGIDSHRLMDIFCRDTKLNISPYYLKPGFAYGGSCLPKDLKAMCMIAYDHYLKCPVLENISVSNNNQKSLVLDKILAFDKKRIGFLGLSFKEGTDDLRNSPIIDILEILLGKGYEIAVYDKNIQLSNLIGANREFILQRIPLLSRFIAEDASKLASASDLIVVVNKEPDFKPILETLPQEKIILDLVNIEFSGRSECTNYVGLAW